MSTSTPMFDASFLDKSSFEPFDKSEEYFHKHPPRTWDFGRFLTYCYELPGFPHMNRKPFARSLWDYNLEKLTTCNDFKMRDHAMRLLNSTNGLGSKSAIEPAREPSRYAKQTTFDPLRGSSAHGRKIPIDPLPGPSTNVYKPAGEPVRGPLAHTRKVPSDPDHVSSANAERRLSEPRRGSPTHANQPPSEPTEPVDERPGSSSKRKSLCMDAPEYDGEKSASPSPEPAAEAPPPTPPVKKLRSVLPRPPSNKKPSGPSKKASSAAPNGPSSVEEQSGRQKLIHLRETLLRDISATVAELSNIEAEAHRLRQSATLLCSRLDSKLKEIINDPQILASDTMLTDKDDGDSEDDSVIEVTRLT